MTEHSEAYLRGWNDSRAVSNEVILDLETRWRNAAAKMRLDHTRKPWWSKPYVLPAYDRLARDIEAAANGLKAIRQVINAHEYPAKE